MTISRNRPLWTDWELAYPVGIKRGTLLFSGIGPDSVWTLKHKYGYDYDVFTIFSKIILNRSYFRIRFGQEHLCLHGTYGQSCYGGTILNRHSVKRMLQGQTVRDRNVRTLRGLISSTSRQLFGKRVVLTSHSWKFSFMSEAYYDALVEKKLGIDSGFYLDKNGFCRMHHSRRGRICKFKTKEQCIFLKTIEEIDSSEELKKRQVCGRHNELYREARLSQFEEGKISGTVGECNDLRGIEL